MKRIVILALSLVALSAIDARAQQGAGSFKGFLTGHAGAIAGGDISEARATLGASIAVHEDTGWGAEIDFGHTPDVLAGRQILDVTSYIVNATWARPDGLVRPFGTAGAGILQINGCDAPCPAASRTYDFGLSAGAGAYVVLSDVAALRADARYFFSSADHPDLRRPNNFNFVRVSFGVTFMWDLAP